VSRFLNSVLLGLLLVVGFNLSATAQKQWVVALDLSDRILTTPHCAENDKVAIQVVFDTFENSVRRALVINSKDEFQVKILPQKGSPLDAQVYEKRLMLNMATTPVAEKAKQLQAFKKQLGRTLDELYQKARFSARAADYQGVDTWVFFNDVVPIVTPKGYHTQLLFLTDGHFDFESYNHTLQHRNLFTHSQFIHTLKGVDWQMKAEKQGLGLLPTSRKMGNLSVSVKGIRAKSADILELDKMRYFWTKWLSDCGVRAFALE